VTLFELLQVLGPAVAVYAAIRADLASIKVRLQHIERDLYPMDRKDRDGGRGPHASA
jgi:hypothetical protein